MLYLVFGSKTKEGHDTKLYESHNNNNRKQLVIILTLSAALIPIQ